MSQSWTSRQEYRVDAFELFIVFREGPLPIDFGDFGIQIRSNDRRSIDIEVLFLRVILIILQEVQTCTRRQKNAQL